jgi:uncharacterized membrane protein|tara:strand:+ start:39113 stop:39313 length:201 start_codon:yes stop_codon:yes gene_type:complete
MTIKNKISLKLKWGKMLSLLTIFLGILLLILMITVEDEPGAIPLLLIIIGTVWYFINKSKIKKQSV